MQRPETTAAAGPEFVTEVLRDAGVIGTDTSVEEVEHEEIGVGVGIVGQLARLALRYRGNAAGAPGSVVVKLPSQYPENRAIGNHFKFYEREGRFYQQIAGKLPVRVPVCYWSHVDVEADRFGLLLEDMGQRTSMSQVAGAGPERAEQSLLALAGLHAAWWDTPELDSLDWMPRLDDPINLAAGEQYRQSWPRFLELFGHALPEGAVEVGEQVQAVFETLVRQATNEAPPTVCHGDFRLDNLLFDDHAEQRDRVALLDWQISYRGPAVSDVGYFLCQSLDVETRRAHEADLLRSWYDAVATGLGAGPGGGIEGYPFDRAWTHYRQTVLSTTVYPVTAGGSMDPANERGRELVELMGQRCFSAALDLDSAELLP